MFGVTQRHLISSLILGPETSPPTPFLQDELLIPEGAAQESGTHTQSCSVASPWHAGHRGPSCAGGVGPWHAGPAGQPPSQQAGAADRRGSVMQTSNKVQTRTAKAVLCSLVPICQILHSLSRLHLDESKAIPLIPRNHCHTLGVSSCLGQQVSPEAGRKLQTWPSPC